MIYVFPPNFHFFFFNSANNYTHIVLYIINNDYLCGTIITHFITMLKILSSSLHNEELSIPFEIDENWCQNHQVVAVLTGGSEGLFLEAVKKGEITLDEPIFLIASQQSNSLAASMEILCWINQHQGIGQILTEAPDVDQDTTEIKDRIGLIGQPSDWLISSTFDRQTLRERLGIEVVDIPISEVTKLGKVDGGMAGALKIYERVKEIIAEYQLTAISLRCFDLLTTVYNTGCIALSKLNDEGIPASCEGDVPTLITMILAKRLTGCPGFQCNPARINAQTGKMLFAHCTLPLTMTNSHSLTTHFESGIGVALHGVLPTGKYTLVKVSGDLKRVFAHNVMLTCNQYEQNLCRTQVWIQASPEAAKTLLTNPISNHHVIVPGHVAELFEKAVL